MPKFDVIFIEESELRYRIEAPDAEVVQKWVKNNRSILLNDYEADETLLGTQDQVHIGTAEGPLGISLKLDQKGRKVDADS